MTARGASPGPLSRQGSDVVVGGASVVEVVVLGTVVVVVVVGGRVVVVVGRVVVVVGTRVVLVDARVVVVVVDGTATALDVVPVVGVGRPSVLASLVVLVTSPASSAGGSSTLVTVTVEEGARSWRSVVGSVVLVGRSTCWPSTRAGPRSGVPPESTTSATAQAAATNQNHRPSRTSRTHRRYRQRPREGILTRCAPSRRPSGSGLGTLSTMGARPDEMVRSRPFRAGTFDFVVETSSAHLTEVVQQLFADYPTPDRTPSELTCFTLIQVNGSVWQLGQPIGVTVRSLPAALAILASEVNLGSLGADPTRLHLHASGAVKADGAVVMPAARDSGKTTTIVRLALRGWCVLSDETIAIDLEAHQVCGYAKPLSVKPGGLDHLPELTPHVVPRGGDPTADVLHVPMSAFGAKTTGAATPRLITALTRGPGEVPGYREVDAADMVVRLMADTLDAGRFGPGAVLSLARLAARSSCYEVMLGSPERTADLIEELFGLSTRDDAEPEALVDGSPRIPSHVVSVLIGDRAVLHDQTSGRILALDAPATKIWLALGRWSGGEAVDLDAPVESSFVEQLVALGLVVLRIEGG
jgi:hypothetical protein